MNGERITTYIKYQTKEGKICTLHVESWDCEIPFHRMMNLVQTGAVILDIRQD